jgi:hypothetical protein
MARKTSTARAEQDTLAFTAAVLVAAALLAFAPSIVAYVVRGAIVAYGVTYITCADKSVRHRRPLYSMALALATATNLAVFAYAESPAERFLSGLASVAVFLHLCH